MKNKFKVAIIGYGKMGRIRTACIEKRDDCEIVAICDTDPGHLLQGIPFVSDYKEILSFRPDIVFVCTFNKFIPEIVCFFLAKGIHVFSEKPPGRTVHDVEKMVEADQKNPSIKLKFGFNHRYHQAVMDAKNIVDKGRLGEVMWVRGIYGKGGGTNYDRNWRNNRELSGGGILIDQGIHMVDLFRLFCGEFQEVKSLISRSYWPVDVEDNAFILLRNHTGKIGMIHSSATQWQHTFLLDIYMKKGYVSISGILSSTKIYGKESLKIAQCLYDKQGYPLPNPEETITFYDEDHSWMLELEEFFNSIRQDGPVQVGSSMDALKTMRLIDQIYRSDLNQEPETVPFPKEVFSEDSRLT